MKRVIPKPYNYIKKKSKSVSEFMRKANKEKKGKQFNILQAKYFKLFLKRPNVVINIILACFFLLWSQFNV